MKRPVGAGGWRSRVSVVAWVSFARGLGLCREGKGSASVDVWGGVRLAVVRSCGEVEVVEFFCRGGNVCVLRGGASAP